MKYPDEIDLISFFECEPKQLDGDEIPFEYNESEYLYGNDDGQEITFKIQPSYSFVHIVVNKNNVKITDLKFNHISSTTILSDDVNEKRIMLTSNNFCTKIQIKPLFKLELIEERE